MVHATLRAARPLLTLVLFLGLSAGAVAQSGIWTDLRSAEVPLVGPRLIAPENGRTLHVDTRGLEALLATAPEEARPGRTDGGALLAIPMPDGGFTTFSVVEAPIMAEELQARYPSIRTYVGQGIDDPRAHLRMSVTPQGIHVVGQSRGGMFYLDPYSQFDREHVIAYWRRDARRAPGFEFERLHDHYEDDLDIEAWHEETLGDRDAGGTRFSHGSQLRTYRAAISATAQYTAFHSSGTPNVEQALAAIVVSLNRLNELYEREVAIRFNLVANNDTLIFTDPNNQPFTNNNLQQFINQNQTVIDQRIGAANYDIGHGFGTAGGGLAQLGAVCTSGKARGVTGLPQPIGDGFDIDYVGHEMGHQFAAPHTFNSSQASCVGQRSASSAYEPGSGSTIMAYAGLCTGQNVQGFSDPYFHNITLQQIINFTTTGFGSQCGVLTETDVVLPTIVASSTLNVPASTPFVLRAEIEDGYEGDEEALTYTWEGFDLGAASPPPPTASWNGQAPFFRSYMPGNELEFPSTGAVRFFPRVDRYTAGLNTLGEGFPTATQLTRYRVTVRTNSAGIGGVIDRQINVPIVGTAGPFRVTSQATAGTILEGGDEVEVTWDVADTNTSAFGAVNVAIYLSLTRHEQFAAGEAISLGTFPNDGAATVTIPAGFTSTSARIYVKAAEGAFYAVNAADVNVLPGVSAEEGATPRLASLSAVYPNPLGLQHRGTVNLRVEQTQAVRVVVLDALGREVVVLHDGPMAAGGNHQFVLGGRSLSAGTYFVRATGERFVETRPFTVVR